jgi:phosphoribulokinase
MILLFSIGEYIILYYSFMIFYYHKKKTRNMHYVNEAINNSIIECMESFISYISFQCEYKHKI